MTPALALPHSVNSAARTTCAPGLAGSRQGRPWISRSIAPRSSQCQRRVELDLVDPVAVAVVGAQDRLVALGPAAVLERLGAAGGGARLPGAVDAPAAALALERLAQREVELEQVDRLQRRRLVEDVAGGVADVDRGHGRLLGGGRSAARGRRRGGREPIM